MIRGTIKRVIVAPLNASHRQEGQYRAFEEIFGLDYVQRFDWMGVHRSGDSPGARLHELALAVQPDWIWLQVQQGGGIEPAWIWSIRRDLPKCIITHWMGDCRTSVSDELRALCECTHGTLVSSVGQLDMYRAAGAPQVGYCQIGLDPWDIDGTFGYATSVTRVPDVVFIGNHYSHVADFARGTAEREAAIRHLLARGYDVGVVGSGWPNDIPAVGNCHVKEQLHVYRRAKVALAINHFNDIDRYYSDRLLIALASGTPVAARYVPGLEHEFWDGVDLVMWRTLDELEDRIARIFKHDITAKMMGKNGRERVLRHHTWTARIEQVRPTVEYWRTQL